MSTTEYPTITSDLCKVWSPDDTQQVIDDCELHRLADEVIAAHAGLPGLQQLDDDDAIFHTVALELILLAKLTTDWPDPIGAILADWPAPIVCPGVVP